MIPRLALAIASIAILVILGMKGFVYQQGRSAGSQQQGDSLIDVARREKANGGDKTTISDLTVDYAGANMDLNKALSDYSVFVAEPIESKSFALDSNNIRTWYKFKILEALARKNYIYCSTCSPIAPIPQEMGTPNYDEFFVDTIGGVINIEGVQISQRNSSLHFEPGNKYLMFVNLTPSQVAVIAGGPSGVFQLDKNDSLHPLGNEKARLPAEVKAYFGLKLSAFKSHINR